MSDIKKKIIEYLSPDFCPSVTIKEISDWLYFKHNIDTYPAYLRTLIYKMPEVEIKKIGRGCYIKLKRGESVCPATIQTA